MTPVEAFRQLIRDYYEDDNPCGGTLHAVLDDGNIRDRDVDACVEYALKQEDLDGFVLGMALRALTIEERAIVLKTNVEEWMLNDET